MKAPVSGGVAAGFENARDAFEATFDADLNTGASFAVFRDGAPIVDLYGGWADAAKTTPWGPESLACGWSVTKGVTALVMARLVEGGVFSYQTRVAEVWPDFATGGKSDATIGHVLAHQAGAPGAGRPITEADVMGHDGFAAALAAAPALWPPGTDAAYHPISGGHILNEVVRRATGRTIGRHLSDDIAGPRQADVFIGLPQSRDGDAVQTHAAPGVVEERAARAEAYPSAADSILNPPLVPGQPNRRDWRASEIPGGNVMASALGLAKIFDAALRGAIVSPETLAIAAEERVDQLDRLVRTPLRLSYGFMLNDADGVFGPSPRAFGHTGFGGAFVFADPETRMAVAFMPNRMLPEGDDLIRRREMLLRALGL